MKYIELPVFNPNLLSVGFLQIRWYSLAYIIPLILSWYIIELCNKKFDMKLYDDKSVFSDDYFFYAVLGIIIGGRIGYVLFYNFKYFIQNPGEILEIWKGGMSFHGGLLGATISLYLFSKKHKVDFFKMADICTIVAPIALFLGRIANFINLELYGRVSYVRWAMVFPFTDGRPRHPSQLYEAFLEGLVLFLIMLYVTWKKKMTIKGLNGAVFLMFYSIFRIISEFFREPDTQIGFLMGYFTMGQLLTLPIFALACYLFYKKIKPNA